MKKHLLGSLLALGIITPLFANAAPSGWVLGQPVSSSNWISNAGCTSVINSASCDYTGPSKALRLDYEYEFADEFWAGDRDRKLKNFCYEFKEPTNHGNYNQNLDGSGGENPSFSWTDELKNNIKEGVGYWVDKNTSMVILRANKIYQINAVPQTRSSNNLLVKYVVEYANDKAATTRYQHTECYPYEISRCGDGVVDKDWFRKDPSDPAEECDPAATEWKNRSDGKTCSSTCKIIEPAAPVCGSAYNNQTEYTTSSSHWLTSSSTNLCDEGGVVDFSYTPQTGGPRIYTWNCKNGSKKTGKLCTARQERCGDGVKNGEEDCDDGDKNGTNASSCSKTCTTVGNAECGQKNKTKTYFTGGRQSTPWLTETSPQMCADGQIVGKPVMVGDHIEWTCSNQNGTQKTCKAYQEWCGDGVTNGDETCDGGELCDAECKIIQTDGCTKIYTGSFRIGDSHLFEDKFDAGWHDRYLYYKDVSFVENYGDHNNGTNPDFDWSQELKNNGMFLAANTVNFPGIKANSVYKFINKPTKRASNNIEIEYTIWYGNDKVSPAPDKRNLYKHKECAYYEISRCGDGVLDTKYGEECDPEIEPWKSNHRCDPVTCKEKDSLIGHLDIKKTLTGKLTVENTGEILTWEVKVTALSGDVDGFEIQDIIPFALKYIDYEVSSNPDKLTVNDPMGPTKTSTGNVYTWTTKGVLHSGHSLLLKVKTEVVLMPKTESDYRNVACVVKDNKTEDCDNDKPKQPSLRIKKYFLNADGSVTKDSKTVKIGDEIVYKIIFGNSGNAAATITSIKDFLPKNVKYVSSEIHIERNSNHSSGSQIGNEEFKGYKIVDGMYIDIYGGITLEPGDQGYIILTGKVLNENKDSTTNFACIYLNGERIDCDDVVHNITSETVSCIPTLSPSSFADVCSSDTSSFSTTVTCKSSGDADIEILCDGIIIKTGHVSQLTGTCSSNVNDSEHKAQCKINGSLTGQDGKSCEASFRRNTKSCGGSSCFVAGTKVLMGDGKTWKNIEDIVRGESIMGESGPNEVKGLDQPKLGNDRNLWSINGSEPFVSDEHPFKTEDGWKAIDAELAKLEILHAIASGWLIKDTQTEDLLNIKKLEVGDVLIMGNGETEKIKTLEKGTAKNGPDTQLYNFRLDGDNTYYANGYLVHNKGGGGGGSSSPICKKIEINDNDVTCSSTEAKSYFRLECGDNIYYSKNKDRDYTFENVKCKDSEFVRCAVSKDGDEDGTWKFNGDCIKKQTISSVPQGCFNVNAGNFSIEEGEILPFYWNMKNMDYFFKKINKDNYTEMNGDYKNAPSNYEAGGDCTDDQEGKIATDSMVCEFNIYDGNIYHKGMQNGKPKDNPLYTIEGPCLSKKSAIKTNDLIEARYNKMVQFYCEDGQSDDCVFYFEKGKSSSAVLPTAVYYIQNFGKNNAGVQFNAGGDEGDWSAISYLGSKDDKSFGEYMIELSRVKYLVCEDKKRQKKDTSIKGSEAESYFIPCQNHFVLTNSYTVQKTPSGNLTASINELEKYRDYSGTITFDMLLNAIQSTDYKPNTKINDAMSAFINKYEKLAVKLNNSSFLEGTEVSKVPGKSIYFVYGDVKIKGGSSEITKPFTIVQTAGNTTINGNVSHNMMLLTNGNIIFQGNCDYDQNVKGIFYAAGNLIRAGVNKNNEISHNYWCMYGGLHVKGVLIGNNFNNLMNKSRSNLNRWFQVNGDDNQIKSQRRKYIMDGASVVIEYSPSIFTKSTMPPGAEDFTTALSIYKQ